MKKIIPILLGLLFISNLYGENLHKVTKAIDGDTIIFDANNLMDKRISQIKEELGTPSDEWISNETQLRLGWGHTVEWHKSGIGLSIDYKGKERIDYIYITNYGAKYTKQQLMKMTNLSSGTKRYIIKEQKIFSEPGITGLHVCGKGAKNSSCR